MRLIKRIHEWDTTTSTIIWYSYYKGHIIGLSIYLYKYLLTIDYYKNCNYDNWLKFKCFKIKQWNMK